MERTLFTKPLTDLLTGSSIEAVYLFGSQALGNAHQDSDYDIAIFVPDKTVVQSRQLLHTVADGFKYPEKLQVSVVDLKNSPLLLLYEIIKNGIRLYENNRIDVNHLEAHIMHRYFDDKHRLNTFYQYLKNQYAS